MASERCLLKVLSGFRVLGGEGLGGLGLRASGLGFRGLGVFLACFY